MSCVTLQGGDPWKLEPVFLAFVPRPRPLQPFPLLILFCPFPVVNLSRDDYVLGLGFPPSGSLNLGPGRIGDLSTDAFVDPNVGLDTETPHAPGISASALLETIPPAPVPREAGGTGDGGRTSWWIPRQFSAFLS